MASKKRRSIDEDAFIPPKNARTTKKPKNAADERSQSLLSKSAEKIWALHNTGMPVGQIAKALIAENKLAPNGVTGRQVTQWIQYHKNDGTRKTHEVSEKHNNMRADDAHNCMFLAQI